MAKNAVEFVETVVGQHQLALAFGGVLNQHRGADFFGQ